MSVLNREFFNWFIVFVLCIFSFVFALPNFINIDNTKKINLGLDLRGGSSLIFEIDFDSYLRSFMVGILDDIKKDLKDTKNIYMTDSNQIFAEIDNESRKKINNNEIKIEKRENGFLISLSKNKENELKKNVMIESIRNLRKRIDFLGTKEISINQVGEKRIMAQVPHGNDLEGIKLIAGKMAKMSMSLISDDVKTKKKIDIDGSMLKKVGVSNISNKYSVTFALDAVGAKRFSKVTAENIGKRLAIIIDDEVITAPVITGHIFGGNVEISGNFNSKSANELAIMLRSGALPAPIKMVSESFVGPSVGQKAIDDGKKAIALAFSFISIIMIVIYKRFGVYASMSLFVNLSMIVALLTIIGSTLTLPGIAGIILTIGMAVDSNIIIFERIKESKQKSIRKFEKTLWHAIVDVLDANMTTLIAGLILFIMGAGPIRGFSVALSIGIFSSMLTSVFMTNVIIKSRVYRKFNTNKKSLLS